MIKSHSLVFSDFDTDWYKHWAKELKQNKNNLLSHALRANKFWQNAVMCQILEERDMLVTGKSCIGFGVGRERLPAVFAKHGVHVTATDQDATTEKAQHWSKHELAVGPESLNQLKIASPAAFKKNVGYMPLDMTDIPNELHGQYDFLWSNCALGHLGSIEAGLKFIRESAKCLKPGGYAVHTTELNVISDTDTLDYNPETVIFRPRDIYALSKQLLADNCEIDPLQVTFGTTDDDQRISISPEFGNDYSKLQVGGHLITQVVLIIHRPLRKPSGVRKKLVLQRQRAAYRTNLAKQRSFEKSSNLVRQIRAYEKAGLAEGSITPKQHAMSVTVGKKPKYVYLQYKNNSGYPIFGMHDRFYTTKPIALATASPVDRESNFRADDWYTDSANRPSIHLVSKDKDGEWQKVDYIRPDTEFAYRVKLDASKAPKGAYSEHFGIVQEGVGHLRDTEICLTIKV